MHPSSRHSKAIFLAIAALCVAMLFLPSARASSARMSVTASANPVNYGEEVTLTASLNNANAPNGTVTFYDGSYVLATVPIQQSYATLSTSQLQVGSHIILVTYSGDGFNAAAGSDALMLKVLYGNTNHHNGYNYYNSFPTIQTGLSLGATGNPVWDGDSVSFTAHVYGGQQASGTVAFYDGTTLLGSTPLVSGIATISLPDLPVGTHVIVARYSGDKKNGPSSQSILQTVRQRNALNDTCDYSNFEFWYSRYPYRYRSFDRCIQR